jgi:hypothetical protein
LLYRVAINRAAAHSLAQLFKPSFILLWSTTR